MSRDVSEQSLALAVRCWRLRCDHACSHPREEAIAFMPANVRADHIIDFKIFCNADACAFFANVMDRNVHGPTALCVPRTSSALNS